jgi:hypothetical protein
LAIASEIGFKFWPWAESAILMKFQLCWLRVLTKIELSIKSITKIKLLIESITKIKLSIDISNGLLLKSAPDPLPKIENAMERALTN